MINNGYKDNLRFSVKITLGFEKSMIEKRPSYRLLSRQDDLYLAKIKLLYQANLIKPVVE